LYGKLGIKFAVIQTYIIYKIQPSLCEYVVHVFSKDCGMKVYGNM